MGNCSAKNVTNTVATTAAPRDSEKTEDRGSETETGTNEQHWTATTTPRLNMARIPTTVFSRNNISSGCDNSHRVNSGSLVPERSNGSLSLVPERSKNGSLSLVPEHSNGSLSLVPEHSNGSLSLVTERSSSSGAVKMRELADRSSVLQRELSNLRKRMVSMKARHVWRRKSGEPGGSFCRLGVSQQNVVMSTPSSADKPWEAKLRPGIYDIRVLIDFPDIPTPVPRHARIPARRSDWRSAAPGESGTESGFSSGRLRLSPGAIGTVVPVEIATNVLLEFYGCTLIDRGCSKQIHLRDEHVVQDFTYSPDYFRKYAKMKGGLEVHEFAHFDCPLDPLKSSGMFVLGKWSDDKDDGGDDNDGEENVLCLTAFRVPRLHALYVPGGVIHTNDYLSGTWRTMLSWTATEPIDHVHLVVGDDNDPSGEEEHASLTIEACPCGPILS